MRKLLIKLVAIETALVGWLSYWIFLVYANNPSVSAELVTNLQRFPQLSFSTIDIAVLVIIAALAVTLAFKFQRGLRPGIRLERALQMLENLMKRNLVLEAQVSELKIEKSHTPPIITSTAPPPPMQTNEPRPGSWEKAFRTPLEAVPAMNTSPSAPVSDETPFGRESSIPPPRIEPKSQSPSVKPPMVLTDSSSEKMMLPPLVTPDKNITAFHDTPRPPASSWEDSPQYMGESKGILTPSSPPRRAPPVSSSSGLRQPYIPAPAPRAMPSSVIVGPMTSQGPPKLASPTVAPKITARPTRTSVQKSPVPPSEPTTAATNEAPKPDNPIPTIGPPSSFPTDSVTTPSVSQPSAADARIKTDEVEKSDTTSTKPVQLTRKRPSPDED